MEWITEFAITDEGFNPILNNSLAPNTLYWARIYSGLSFVILSSNPSRSITRRAMRSISNAELKDLDTAYIELVPSPGAGKYIQVLQLWMKRTGQTAYLPTRLFTGWPSAPTP